MSLPYVVRNLQAANGSLNVEAPIQSLSLNDVYVDIVNISATFDGTRTRVTFSVDPSYSNATGGSLNTGYHHTFNVATQEFLFDVADGDLTSELYSNAGGSAIFTQCVIGMPSTLFPTGNNYTNDLMNDVTITINGTGRAFGQNAQLDGNQSSGTTICLEIGSSSQWLSSIAVGQTISVSYADSNAEHTSVSVVYDGTNTPVDLLGVTKIVSYPYEGNEIVDAEFKEGATHVAFSNSSSVWGVSTVLEVLNPSTGLVTHSYNGVLNNNVTVHEATGYGIILSSGHGDVSGVLANNTSPIRYKTDNNTREESILYYNRYGSNNEVIVDSAIGDNYPFCEFNPIENLLPFIPVPSTVTGAVSVPAVGGYVDIGHNVTVKSGGSLTLGVSDIGNVRIGAGYAIIAEPGGKVKLSGGHEITVENGTLFKFRTVPVG